LERRNIKVDQKPRAPERVIDPEKHPSEQVQDLSSMSIDELWGLHQKVCATLVAKIAAAKDKIAAAKEMQVLRIARIGSYWTAIFDRLRCEPQAMAALSGSLIDGK
jgi:hypothetical protein